MTEFLFWLFCGWLAWVLINSLLFVAGLLWAKHENPAFDGVRIHMPERFVKMVTGEELAAAYMHEAGHRYHLHVWENLLRLLFCAPCPESRRVQQELEADDFVSNPVDLAGFLLKTSHHPFDLYRARRLLDRAERSRDAGNPSARDERVPTHGVSQ